MVMEEKWWWDGAEGRVDVSAKLYLASFGKEGEPGVDNLIGTCLGKVFDLLSENGIASVFWWLIG
jgi:hypothetical protein